MRAKSVGEILKILHNHSTLISAIFDSSGRAMNINSAIGMSDSDTLSLLEEYNIIEIFNNEVMLDDQIVHMLESHLIDGYDENLYDYADIFKKIDGSISKYYGAIDSGSDAVRHLRDIQRELQRMPRNLLDTLRGIQRHVEFTYRSASNAQQKIQELKSYNESLLRFESKITFIRNELMRLMGFFNHSGDSSIILHRMRLRAYLEDISNTLIHLNSSVVEYIRKTHENIRFYKHLVELKELKDRREIIDKTNLFELVHHSKKEPLLSGFSTVEKLSYSVKLHPDYATYFDFEQKVLSRGAVTAFIGKTEASIIPIDEELFKEEIIESISYSVMLGDYLETAGNESLLEFIYRIHPDIDEKILLESYLSAAVVGEKYLSFNEETTNEVGTHNCTSVYLKPKE